MPAAGLSCISKCYVRWFAFRIDLSYFAIPLHLSKCPSPSDRDGLRIGNLRLSAIYFPGLQLSILQVTVPLTSSFPRHLVLKPQRRSLIDHSADLSIPRGNGCGFLFLRDKVTKTRDFPADDRLLWCIMESLLRVTCVKCPIGNGRGKEKRRSAKIGACHKVILLGYIRLHPPWQLPSATASLQITNEKHTNLAIASLCLKNRNKLTTLRLRLSKTVKLFPGKSMGLKFRHLRTQTENTVFLIKVRKCAAKFWLRWKKHPPNISHLGNVWWGVWYPQLLTNVSRAGPAAATATATHHAISREGESIAGVIRLTPVPLQVFILKLMEYQRLHPVKAGFRSIVSEVI